MNNFESGKIAEHGKTNGLRRLGQSNFHDTKHKASFLRSCRPQKLNYPRGSMVYYGGDAIILHNTPGGTQLSTAGEG